MSDHELRKALDPIADIVGGTGIEASFRLPDCQFVGLKKRAALPCLKVTQHGRDGGRRVSCRKDFKGALLTPNEIPMRASGVHFVFQRTPGRNPLCATLKVARL